MHAWTQNARMDAELTPVYSFVSHLKLRTNSKCVQSLTTFVKVTETGSSGTANLLPKAALPQQLADSLILLAGSFGKSHLWQIC